VTISSLVTTKFDFSSGSSAGSPKAEAGPGTLLNLSELLLSEPPLTRISAVTSCTLWVIPKDTFQVGGGDLDCRV
jgi:CRP-like cAMP-binding protein